MTEAMEAQKRRDARRVLIAGYSRWLEVWRETKYRPAVAELERLRRG